MAGARVSLSVAGLIGVLGLGCDLTSPSGQLNSARGRWEDRGPAAYRITLFRSCECLAEMTGPVVIEVRDGQVDTRTYTFNGETPGPTYDDIFVGVEGLFDLIADAISQDAARVEVTYHPILGYPERIAIDYHARYVDDEVTYTLTDFQWR